MESNNMNTNDANLPTSALTLVETEHGRMRRRQRGIDKKNLKEAMKYGTCRSTHPRPNGDPAMIYTYKDIVYVVNTRTKEEVTCYPLPIDLDYVPVDEVAQKTHDLSLQRIRTDLSIWKSNTVIVVDTSGSMKTCDVWGTKTRLDAVWLSLALDFVADRLENGEAGHLDVVSVVSLGQSPDILISEEPTSWVLYNKLARIYNEKLQAPYGHGPFLPALDVAEELLMREVTAACAMALVFLSDGKPSDAATNGFLTPEDYRDMIATRVGLLAERYGRRLTFTAIGIGDAVNFECLEQMVQAAADFGAQASFRLPSMSSSDLGATFTSVSSTLTTIQTEMTDLATLKQRKVRDVKRESRKVASVPINVVSSEDFWIYPFDRVKRKVYEEWFEDRTRKSKFTEVPLQHHRAKFIAIAKKPFGEGAERFAYRFYELAGDALTIVGAPLVAKESRLVHDEEEHTGYSQGREKFARLFCSTQQLARRLAHEYNLKLDATRRADTRTPRIGFLDCSIYELCDKKMGKQSVLVEERLDEELWHKWNTNNGYVEGQEPPKYTEDSLREAVHRLGTMDLGMIEEGSEEEDDDEIIDDARLEANQESKVLFTPSEVAQAFSHFTYLASGRKRLVCDLQGVYDRDMNLLRFSDPVIHYHNDQRTDRRRVHGNTDHGRKGMAKFFDAHHEQRQCGYLCRLVSRGFRRPRRDYESSHQTRRKANPSYS